MHFHVAARPNVKQPIETDFDVQNHDAGVDVAFRPTESQYPFVLLADRRSEDMQPLKRRVLAIMPPVMSKQRHFV
jgi:hypothetical protein